MKRKIAHHFYQNHPSNQYCSGGLLRFHLDDYVAGHRHRTRGVQYSGADRLHQLRHLQWLGPPYHYHHACFQLINYRVVQLDCAKKSPFIIILEHPSALSIRFALCSTPVRFYNLIHQQLNSNLSSHVSLFLIHLMLHESGKVTWVTKSTQLAPAAWLSLQTLALRLSKL